MGTCHGSIRWRDVDEVSQLGGGEVRDGVVSPAHRVRQT